MIIASSVVSPSSSGLPPNPTVPSHCNSSHRLHPSSTALKAEPPVDEISLFPFFVVTTPVDEKFVFFVHITCCQHAPAFSMRLQKVPRADQNGHDQQNTILKKTSSNKTSINRQIKLRGFYIYSQESLSLLRSTGWTGPIWSTVLMTWTVYIGWTGNRG